MEGSLASAYYVHASVVANSTTKISIYLLPYVYDTTNFFLEAVLPAKSNSCQREALLRRTLPWLFRLGVV